MKLERRRVDRRLRSRTMLAEPEKGDSVLESLDFIKPGDLELLQKISGFDFAADRDTQAAFALPEILFQGQATSGDFREKRAEFIQRAKDHFESWISANPEMFDREQLVRDLMKSAKSLFPFRSLVGPVSRPSEATWNILVQKITAAASKEHASPPGWLEALVCIDPVRFQTLPKEDMQRLCLAQIAKERREYPVSKDNRQFRLLGAMSSTRLLFPDLTQAFTLTEEERAVTRAYLNQQRERLDLEGTTDCAYYLYILSLVEAPGLRVDEKGIHLSGKKRLSHSGPRLPERGLV